MRAKIRERDSQPIWCAPRGASSLERLLGDREGQYSIRINDQWRICFKWSDGAADDVEIVDYH